MNKRWTDILFALVLGIGFPAILLAAVAKRNSPEPQETISLQPTETTVSQTEQNQNQVDNKIAVLMDDGNIQNLELDQYIIGVVLREMPADFELEALKAQAVVARTYAMRRAQTGGKHAGAAVCTNSSCCQGYYAEEEYLIDGGTQAEVDTISQAVTATTGQVLVYNGSMIEATYFSCSGGMTEDALAVWGTDIPYLQATESPGEENAAHYTDTVYFTAQEFSQLLGVTLSGGWESWIESITYTSGGGVDCICICGNTYTGTQLRKLLGLRSTAFTLSVVGDIVTITTKGYGHRVGMSQYGADAMAVQGSTYAEILAHYYQGTELVEY